MGGKKSLPHSPARSAALRSAPLCSAPLRSAPLRAAPLAGSFVSEKVYERDHMRRYAKIQPIVRHGGASFYGVVVTLVAFQKSSKVENVEQYVVGRHDDVGRLLTRPRYPLDGRHDFQRPAPAFVLEIADNDVADVSGLSRRRRLLSSSRRKRRRIGTDGRQRDSNWPTSAKWRLERKSRWPPP